MRPSAPPARLPAEYLHIWQVLRHADEHASSRQALARRLGVATLTLQRILVTGDVPSFQETTSTRVLHAWVRTLSRLAAHFGHDPREWVERVGIRWSARIQGVSDSALRKWKPLALDPGPRPHPPLPADEYRVGAVDRCPYNLPLTPLLDSFFEVYARRLLGAVSRSVRVSCRTATESELRPELAGDPSGLLAGIGLPDTIERRRQGLDFVPIPGLYVKLDAVCVRSGEGSGGFLVWKDVISPKTTDCDFLVLKDHVAGGFLVSQCDLPRERLLVREVADPQDLAGVLAKVAGRPGGRPIILVAEEETCRLTIKELSQLGDFAIHSIDGAAEELPAYSLCLAWRSSDAAWGELLRAAQTQELFARACHQTARLYAELVAATFRHTISGWRLHDFDAATPEFRTAFCRHLSLILTEARLDNPQAAEQLIPEPWRPTLRAALQESMHGAAPRASAPAPLVYCRSCSALLSDGIHGGVSDRYCRFCADEEGRLKPRHEVEDLLSRWIRQWQGGLTDEQARRRAVLLMQAMPAWNEN